MTTPDDRGICGDLIWTAGVTPTRCTLLAEHPGWHRSDNGASWGTVFAADEQDGLTAAYERGVAEGRREATDGWEREWGAQYRNDSWVQATFDSEAEAVEFAAGAIGHRAVSRRVSRWEPVRPRDDADQAEDPQAGGDR